MAATRGKFTLPSVEDLDEGMQIPRTKSLFKASKTSGENNCVRLEDVASRNTKWNGGIYRDTGVQSTPSKQNADAETLIKTNVVIKQSLSHETKDSTSSENCSNKHPSSSKDDPMSSAFAGGVQPVAGKTFRETFAFLEGTSHYKDTMAKIKDKELTKPVREAIPSTSSKPKTNAIIVNPRQKGNPVLKHVRSVPWELGDIIPDYEVGATTCVLFLSLKYHNHYPEYIHERLKHLGQRYELRILLVLVDVPDPHHTLRELAKMAIMADCTLILSWSAEEAGRYLETYKVYENKPPDALMGQSEGDYFSKLTECLTTIKGINKTDCVSLSSTFGCLSNMAKASKEDLAFLPGFGPLKAQRLHDLFHEPFVAKKKDDLSKEEASRSRSNNGL